MKRPKIPALPLPKYDYGLALQSAMSWLGDRYLLAEPVTRLPVQQPAYFAERPRWNEVRPGRRGFKN